MQANPTQLSVQLAEKAVAHYAAMLLGKDKRFTFEGCPDELQIIIVSLLSSLHHLVDRAEIPWRDVLTDAANEYRLISATTPSL